MPMRLLALAAVLAALMLTPQAGAWTWPADGVVLQPFVFDPAHPYAAGQHRGLDIAADAGATVLAPAAGSITFAGSVPSSGKSVTITTPDGYAVTLTHLGSIGAAKGATVAEGAPIGTVALTGDDDEPQPYVHLGVRVAADPQGYVDPASLLPARVPVPPALVPTASAPPTDPAPAAAPEAPAPELPEAPVDPAPPVDGTQPADASPADSGSPADSDAPAAPADAPAPTEPVAAPVAAPPVDTPPAVETPAPEQPSVPEQPAVAAATPSPSPAADAPAADVPTPTVPEPIADADASTHPASWSAPATSAAGRVAVDPAPGRGAWSAPRSPTPRSPAPPVHVVHLRHVAVHVSAARPKTPRVRLLDLTPRVAAPAPRTAHAVHARHRLVAVSTTRRHAAHRHPTLWIALGAVFALALAALLRLQGRAKAARMIARSGNELYSEEDPRRAGVAVRGGIPSPGPCGGLRRALGCVRALPPAQGQQRPDGQWNGRARHTGDGRRRSRGQVVR